MSKNHLYIGICLLLAACNNSSTDENSNTTDGPPPLSSCKMRLLSAGIPIDANKSFVLQFSPLAQPKDSIPPLDNSKNKAIDCVILSQDLSYFSHLYANKDSAGVYSIPASFPAGGDYILMTTYKAGNLAEQTDSFHVHVNGTSPAPVTYKQPVMAATTDGYTIQLLSKKLSPGAQNMLVMKMSHNGSPVMPATLQPYYGEETHMVCVNTVTHEYIRSQSKSDPMNYWYLLNFPRAGLYRAWIEFKHNEQVHTAAFVIEVKGG